MTDYLKKFRLDGKTAVVTGGAGLIGKQIVVAFAQAGAHVILADIDEQGAQAIQAESKKMQGSIEFVSFDITDIDGLQKNIEQLEKKFNAIDVWVNSAYPTTDDWGAQVEEISPESWRKNVDMQMNSYCLSSKYIAEHMKNKGGSIINLGSIYGVVGCDLNMYKGTKLDPGSMIYYAIKGGLINLTKYMASYFGHYNIRVNVVCPGGVYDKHDEAFLKNYEARTPLGRMADPEDVASATLFLASEASSYITGATIMVDGGWTAI